MIRVSVCQCIMIILAAANLVGSSFAEEPAQKKPNLNQRMILIDEYPKGLILYEIRLFPGGQLMYLDGVTVTDKNIKNVLFDSKSDKIGHYVMLSIAD